MSATQNAIDGLQEEPKEVRSLNNLWTLYFRHGMNATLTKNFHHKGDLQSAIKRAQQHCSIMGYKYIFLRPMVCNIDSEEDYKLKGSREGELVP